MNLRSDTELRNAWEAADSDGARMAVRNEWREVWARKQQGEITDRYGLDRFARLAMECALDFGLKIQSKETFQDKLNGRAVGVWVETECYCDAGKEGERFRRFAEKLHKAASDDGLLVTDADPHPYKELPDQVRIIETKAGIVARWFVRVTFWLGPPKEWR